MGYKIKPYEAEDGWRWRMVAPNNRIVADGAQAYASPQNLDRAIAKFEAELGLGMVNREQFLVIRREHWQAATERLQEQFPQEGAVNQEINHFIELVEDAAI